MKPPAVKPHIFVAVFYRDGSEAVAQVEDPSITEPMLHAAEDLLHTLTTGERPIIKNLYELCAKAFGTTREDAKERLYAAGYGMDKQAFDDRKRLP